MHFTHSFIDLFYHLPSIFIPSSSLMDMDIPIIYFIWLCLALVQAAFGILGSKLGENLAALPTISGSSCLAYGMAASA
jgi:hypothetical protein